MSETGIQQQTFDEKFIGYLEKLVRDENRAALANLRRGLGKSSGAAAEMFPYISGWTANISRRDENAFFLVASMIGLYPTKSWKSDEKYNNLGKSLSFLKEESEGIEKRFVALLNSDDEDLPNHLRQIISLLKSSDKPKPINWLQFLKDIKNWSHEDKYVQRNWAKGFWGNTSTNTENTEKGEQK